MPLKVYIKIENENEPAYFIGPVVYENDDDVDNYYFIIKDIYEHVPKSTLSNLFKTPEERVSFESFYSFIKKYGTFYRVIRENEYDKEFNDGIIQLQEVMEPYEIKPNSYIPIKTVKTLNDSNDSSIYKGDFLTKYNNSFLEECCIL